MKIMRFETVQNIHGETYTITVRKHTESEIINEYGFPYSIRIANANPKAFDLNNHVYLYDAWQTAYKRLFELSEVYMDTNFMSWEQIYALNNLEVVTVKGKGRTLICENRD